MSVTRRYYRGHNLVAMRDGLGNQSRYFHFDHQGTTQCLTDSSGAVTDRFASDAWGVQVKRVGGSLNRQWYVGNSGYYAQVDEEYLYIRARWLATRLAEWLASDPDQGEPHRYAYAHSKPTTLVDPSGARCNCQQPPEHAEQEPVWQGTASFSEGCYQLRCNHPIPLEKVAENKLLYASVMSLCFEAFGASAVAQDLITRTFTNCIIHKETGGRWNPRATTCVTNDQGRARSNAAGLSMLLGSTYQEAIEQFQFAAGSCSAVLTERCTVRGSAVGAARALAVACARYYGVRRLRRKGPPRVWRCLYDIWRHPACYQDTTMRNLTCQDLGMWPPIVSGSGLVETDIEPAAGHPCVGPS